MDFICNFHPCQIVYLEHESTRLYAEVIQVGSRPVCWVRPLLLANNYLWEPLVSDLRSTADLVLPLTLFHPALDTEVIPLLVLLTSEPQPERDPLAVEQLNQFIHKVWQAQPSTF